MIDPPAPFVWKQRDAMLMLCTECNQTVRAEVIDLHLVESPGCAKPEGANNHAHAEGIY